MTTDQLIDIIAGLICGIACTRCYFMTKDRRQRRKQWLPRRVVLLNRDRL